MAKNMPIMKNIFNERSSWTHKCNDNVFGDFLVKKGLYDEIEITRDNIFELADLIDGYVKIDSYCCECSENRVFSCEKTLFFHYDDRQEIRASALGEEIVSFQQAQNISRPRFSDEPDYDWKWTNCSIEEETRLMVFKFVCAMNPEHHLDYIVITNGNKMKKIGQYPSVADVSCPELKEYRKVMSKEDEKEFKRAIGLFSAGIGIGSYVYLRRIFERVLLGAGERAIKDGCVKREVFEKARIDEKIKLISNYLPKALVGNTVFYGIISKGIHELSEEECIEYFPVLQSFIVLILRQWEKMRRDEEEEKTLTKSLNSIASKMKKQSSEN